MEWGYASAMQNIQEREVDAARYNEMGLISLALTVLNIICIYFSALAMFKFKEVAPIQHKSLFWDTDVTMNRKLKTLGKGFQDTKEGKELLRRMKRAMKHGGVSPKATPYPLP
uniref:Uncharacterized protein n=1 Tax=Phaeomonas parva TaxID=124430 RepID=A0A7S1UAK9_9STRA|mmetsp:Transcript_39265/g.122911  ORF Transcript_39265/g.122911 Transcript_39265/m.122911 type:complete len:113 (+) Transcript_39265:95-433(+)